MATRNFRGNRAPDIETGMPWGRGFFHTLEYNARVNLVVGENVELECAVPNDEHWYVIQWQVFDFTAVGPLPNGWEAQALLVNFPRQNSQNATFAVPDATGPWTEVTKSGEETLVWSRWWDGVTPVQWIDPIVVALPDTPSVLTVRCTDPVFSMPRWEPGLQFVLKSYVAKVASGAQQGFNFRIGVLRFRSVIADLRREGRDSSQGETMVKDIHEATHRPILGQ